MFNSINLNNKTMTEKKLNNKKVQMAFVAVILTALFVIACQFLCGSAIAADDQEAQNNSNKTIYNITVGSSIIGMDENKWIGQGQDLHYSITEPVSADFYPSTNTLILNGGTLTGYFEYEKTIENKKSTFETVGVIGVNNIDMASDFGKQYNPIELDDININVNAETNIVEGQHKHSSDTSSAEGSDYFHYAAISTHFENNNNKPCNLNLYGRAALNITANVNAQPDAVYAIRANTLNFGKDNKGAVSSSNVNIRPFNFSNKNTGSINAVAVEAVNVNFFSTNLIIDDCNFSSLDETSFTGVGTSALGDITVDKNSTIDIRNVTVSGKKGIEFGDEVRFVGITARGNTGIVNHGNILIASRPDELCKVNYAGDEEDIHYGMAEITCLKVDNSSNGYIQSDGNLDFGNFGVDYTTKTLETSRVWVSWIIAEGSDGGITLKDGTYNFNKNNKSYINYSCNTTNERDVIFRDISCRNWDIELDNVTLTAIDPQINAGDSAWAVSILDICPSSIVNITNSKIFMCKNTITVTTDEEVENNSFFALNDKMIINNSQLTLRDYYGSRNATGFECSNKVVIGKKSVVDVGLQQGSKIIKSPVYSQGNNDNPKIVMDDKVSPYVYYSKDYQDLKSSTTLDETCYGEGVCFFRAFDNDNAFTLTFDTNGGNKIDSQRVLSGYYAFKPDNPTRENYTFKNWCKDSQLQNAWDFSKDTITSDTTIYAKWESNVSPEDKDNNSQATVQTSDFNVYTLIILSILATLSILCLRRFNKNKSN